MRKVLNMKFRRPDTDMVVKVVGVKRENGKAWVKFAPDFPNSQLCYGRIEVEEFNKLIGRDILIEEFDVSEQPHPKAKRRKRHHPKAAEPAATEHREPEEIK